jgi:hypothetical protein
MVLESEASTLLAWVELRQGKPERAQRVVREILETVEQLEDPADRAHRLLYTGRCALRFGAPTRARTIAERLHRDVSNFLLVDYEAATLGLVGCAAVRCGDRPEGVTALEKAVHMARGQGMRPLEVPLRLELGRSLRGSDTGAEHLTRAMEVVQEIVAELPQNLAAIFLGTAENQALRRHFRIERARALGVAV